jgi:hypothetical protein
MFNASNQQGNANQNHSRYNITPVRIAIIKKTKGKNRQGLG